MNSGGSPTRSPRASGASLAGGATLSCSGEEIREQLERILGDPSLARRRQLSALLRYLVAGFLADPEYRPVQYAVGVEALGLPEDFDPESSPVVRVAMNRLRRSLAAYYAETGAEDPVILSLPAPGYRLAVARRRRSRRDPSAPSGRKVAPRLLVLASAGAEEGPEGSVGRVLASELVLAVRRYGVLEVAGPLDPAGIPDPWEHAVGGGHDFLVVVSPPPGGDWEGVRLELWETRHRSLLASSRGRPAGGPGQGSALATTAARWAEEIGRHLDRHLEDPQERPGPELSSFSRALLAGRQYSSTLSEESWEEANRAFGAARIQHPDHPSLLAGNALLQFGGYLEYRARRVPFPEEAGEWTRQALRIDPRNPLARQASAFQSYLLHREEECLERTRAIVEDPRVPRPLKLLPISGCLSLGIGCEALYPYLRALTGELTHYPRQVHVGALVALLAQGEDRLAEEELHRAYSEGQWVERLGRILLCERKGRPEEARTHAADLLRRFPDFPRYGKPMLERRFARPLRQALESAWENARP